MSKLLSIIVPCYNEEAVIEIFYSETLKYLKELKDIRYEILFINDGSKDKTLSILKELSKKDYGVKYLSFSRNFGKESAMYAGLENSKGDYVVLMDADLQDPPSLLSRMIQEIEENNYDCVATKRSTRKGEPIIRSFFAKMFYKMINKISKTEIVDGARDFRMMTRQMVDAILELKEYNRFSKGILSWVGFDTLWLEYENIERAAGETKWSFFKLLIYSIDGIVAFSTAPLVISSLMGVLCCLLAVCMMLFFVIRTLLYGDPVAGYPSTISIILFLGGIQLLSVGILGQYISKSYLETKNRPIYITKETNIKKEDK